MSYIFLVVMLLPVALEAVNIQISQSAEVQIFVEVQPQTRLPARFDHLAKVSSIIFQGKELLSVDGLCDEFGADGQGVCGYNEMRNDGLFLKIGIGLLRRDTTKEYDHERCYSVEKTFPVNFHYDGTKLEVSQRVAWNRFGYTYTKVYQYQEKTKTLRISWRLYNEGCEKLTFSHYNHNYFCRQPVGAPLKVNFPLPSPPSYTNMTTTTGEIRTLKPDAYWRIEFLKPLKISVTLPHGITITPSSDIFRFAFYTDDQCYSPEMFIRLSCLPKKEVTWDCCWHLGDR